MIFQDIKHIILFYVQNVCIIILLWLFFYKRKNRSSFDINSIKIEHWVHISLIFHNIHIIMMPI